jgi:hypothetical protein
VEKNERRKSEITQAYRIPLSTLSMHLKIQDYIEQQALQGGDILKLMRIHGAKHSNMENKLFDRFCHV